MVDLAEIDVVRLVGLLTLKDPSVAPVIREMGNRLLALADKLETKTEEPFKTPSGMVDRVKMQVNRPDGSSTTTDTGVS